VAAAGPSSNVDIRQGAAITNNNDYKIRRQALTSPHVVDANEARFDIRGVRVDETAVVADDKVG